MLQALTNLTSAALNIVSLVIILEMKRSLTCCEDNRSEMTKEDVQAVVDRLNGQAARLRGLSEE